MSEVSDKLHKKRPQGKPLKKGEFMSDMIEKHLLLEICERYKAGLTWEQICKMYGGMSLYVPKVSPSAKEQIKAEFNGYNIAFLAYKYNLSQNSVRAIVRESKDDAPLDKES